MKKINWIWIGLLLAILFSGALQGEATGQKVTFSKAELEYIEENPVIYVGGNPNLFPIEYYDKEKKVYVGIFPDYFVLFQELSGIEFRYLNPGKMDKRMYLAKNNQVEIISAVRNQELENRRNAPTTGKTLLTIGNQNDREEISFAYTSIADERLKGIMEKCYDSLSYEKKEEIYLKNSVKELPTNFYATILPIGLAIMLCFIIIYMLIVKKKAKNYQTMIFAQQRIDEVTGFKNMQYLMEYYKEQIKGRERSNYWTVYFDIGLNQLAEVYGGEETTQILKAIAKIMKSNVENDDLFARIEGNYFMLLVKAASENVLLEKVKRIQHKIAGLPKEMEKSYELHSVVGSYQLKHLDSNFMEAVRKSMLASKHAKDSRTDYILYDDKIERMVVEECELEKELMQGILNDEFSIFLQPYFSLNTGQMEGCEALVRWDNPIRGLLKPYKFISILEKKNMIDKMDLLVFENVCKLLKRRKESNQELFTIACNFSKQSYEHKEFANNLIEIVRDYEIDSRYITIEITEGLGKSKSENRDVMFARLVEEGFTLVVDNFGAGYSSYTDLAKYQIGIVELDRELISNIDLEGVSIAVEGIIEIFHKMGMKTMCKGAETKEQLLKIASLGCDYAQGYYYFQPMESQQLELLYNGGKLQIEKNK